MAKQNKTIMSIGFDWRRRMLSLLFVVRFRNKKFQIKMSFSCCPSIHSFIHVIELTSYVLKTICSIWFLLVVSYWAQKMLWSEFNWNDAMELWIEPRYRMINRYCNRPSHDYMPFHSNSQSLQKCWINVTVAYTEFVQMFTMKRICQHD